MKEITNTKIQAIDKMTKAMDKLTNVLLGKYLVKEYQELTGKEITFLVSDEPVDVSEYKKSLRVGYESHVKEHLHMMLTTLADQHDPEYVVVVITDNQIWFYFN